MGDRRWAIWSLSSYLALRGSYIQKTVDTLTQGRQLADPEKERQLTARTIRLVLLFGLVFGFVIIGLGIASLIAALLD